jgi:hypothetical protein
MASDQKNELRFFMAWIVVLPFMLNAPDVIPRLSFSNAVLD